VAADVTGRRLKQRHGRQAPAARRGSPASGRPYGLVSGWQAVVLTHPALGGCRKEALAAVALGNWLLRR